MKKNPDGSLTIYLQNKARSIARERSFANLKPPYSPTFSMPLDAQ